MNIGNAMNPILITQPNQTASNSTQCTDSDGEVSLGQSLFKQLLLSNPNLKAALLKANQAKQGNVGRTVETMDEIVGEEEIETTTDCKDVCQVMSSMDMNRILNNENLNKIDLIPIETANKTLIQKSLPIVEQEMVQVDGQTLKFVPTGKAEAVTSESHTEPIISKSQIGTSIPGSQDKTIIFEGKTDGIEMKPLHQGIQTDLKRPGQGGVEIPDPNIRNEMKMGKFEILTGGKEKIEEKSMGVENGEMIPLTHKPGNNVIDQIEMDPKNGKLENVPVYNQIAEEIAAKLEQKGPMAFKLQLKPENLGEIDINIKISEGKLSIDIMSASSKTQDLLTSQVDKLVAKLGLQNFQIENIQVNPSTTAGTLNHEATNQSALLNMAMNFSDRRQQENLKDESLFKKDVKGISGLILEGKEHKNSIEVLRGKEFTQHKINYAI